MKTGLSVVLIVFGVIFAAVFEQSIGALIVVLGVLGLIFSLLFVASSGAGSTQEDIESGVNEVRMRHRNHI
jgi:hypothetical protein